MTVGVEESEVTSRTGEMPGSQVKAGLGRTPGRAFKLWFCALLALRVRYNAWAGDREKRSPPSLPLPYSF